MTAVSREDVVLQRPEDVRFLVQVFHTTSACAGAATAYLLRRIAYRAGAYAPGIQEHIFHELNTSREGGSIEKVQHWFTARVSSLHELGYRLQCRRVATPTPAILDWVRAGRGYRGAMLPTNYRKLHPVPGTGVLIGGGTWHVASGSGEFDGARAAGTLTVKAVREDGGSTTLDLILTGRATR